MNGNRTFLAVAGALVLLTGPVVLAQTATVAAVDPSRTPATTPVATAVVAPVAVSAAATPSAGPNGHFSTAAFNRTTGPAAGGNAPPAKLAPDPGVVVTYDNNRSSVVVTGSPFGFGHPVSDSTATPPR